MGGRSGIAGLLLVLTAMTAWAQSQDERQRGWRGAGDDEPYYRRVSRGGRRSPRPTARFVSSGQSHTAGGEHGQVFREYDIRAYTERAADLTQRPQQAIIDWILRETGYEIWHSDVQSILCATRDVLKVYHQPRVLKNVDGIVQRFLSRANQSHYFSLRVVTFEEPDWRARAFPYLRPVATQTQGVQAWLLKREEAAILLAGLNKRQDYREPPEHSIQPMVINGQSYVLSSLRSTKYLRNIVTPQDGPPVPEAVPDEIDEGLAMEFSPLLTLNGKTVDAVLKCHIDQVEQLRPVTVEVRSIGGQRQGVRIDVPQMSQFRLQERFRWPVDEVLVVCLGIVPTPHQSSEEPFSFNRDMTGNFHRMIGAYPPPRAEVLIFIESKGSRAGRPIGGAKTAVKPVYHNRY